MGGFTKFRILVLLAVCLAAGLFMALRGPVTGSLHTSIDTGPLPILVESYCHTRSWHASSERTGYSIRTVNAGDSLFVPWGLSGERGCRIVFQHPRIATQVIKFEPSVWQSLGEIELEPPLASGLDFDSATSAALDHVHRGGIRYFSEMRKLGFAGEIDKHADAEIRELYHFVEEWKSLATVHPSPWPVSARKVMETLRKAEAAVGYAAPLDQLCETAGDKSGPMKLRELVQQGGYVNGWCTIGRTPLNQAIRSGGTEKIEILLNAGASPNDPWSFNTETAVSWAGRSSDLDTLLFVAERSDNHELHNAVDELVGDKLVQAAAAGRVEWFQRYIALQSSTLTIDLESSTGATALHGAFAGDQVELALLLLESGADPTIVSQTGQRLQDYVTESAVLSAKLAELGLLDRRP